jgi:hypothetical protein
MFPAGCIAGSHALETLFAAEDLLFHAERVKIHRDRIVQERKVRQEFEDAAACPLRRPLQEHEVVKVAVVKKAELRRALICAVPNVLLNGQGLVELRQRVVAESRGKRGVYGLYESQVMLLVVHGSDPTPASIKKRPQDAEVLLVCLILFGEHLLIMPSKPIAR